MIWFPQDVDELWVAHDEAIDLGGSTRDLFAPRCPRVLVSERSRSKLYTKSWCAVQANHFKTTTCNQYYGYTYRTAPSSSSVKSA